MPQDHGHLPSSFSVATFETRLNAVDDHEHQDEEGWPHNRVIERVKQVDLKLTGAIAKGPDEEQEAANFKQLKTCHFTVRVKLKDVHVVNAVPGEHFNAKCRCKHSVYKEQCEPENVHLCEGSRFV